MTERDEADARARAHRALGHPTRVQIMERLEVQPADVRELVGMTGLHHNTVRAHLAVLENSGLVQRTKVPRTGPGRPAWRYEPARFGALVEERFESLAGAVIDALLLLSDSPAAAAQAAEGAGVPWGQGAVRGERRADLASAVDRVHDLLADLGFSPALEVVDDDEPRLVLRTCPFADLARSHGEVVCSIHLGVLRGALAELGAPVTAELHPFVQPDRCTVELRTGT